MARQRRLRVIVALNGSLIEHNLACPKDIASPFLVAVARINKYNYWINKGQAKTVIW